MLKQIKKGRAIERVEERKMEMGEGERDESAQVNLEEEGGEAVARWRGRKGWNGVRNEGTDGRKKMVKKSTRNEEDWKRKFGRRRLQAQNNTALRKFRVSGGKKKSQCRCVQQMFTEKSLLRGRERFCYGFLFVPFSPQ